MMKNNRKKKRSFIQDFEGYEWVLWLILFILLYAGACVPPLQSYYSQANKAKQSEAKQYVGSINRAQEAKYAENGSFVNSIEALGIGIKTETTNYHYSIETTKNTAFNYGVAKDKKITSFAGGVFVVKFDQVKQETTNVAILCQEEEAGTTKPNPPKLENDQPVCGEGTEEVKK